MAAACLAWMEALYDGGLLEGMGVVLPALPLPPLPPSNGGDGLSSEGEGGIVGVDGCEEELDCFCWMDCA